jgi:hypothetical protein
VSETAAQRFDRQQQGNALKQFLRAGPYEPLATRDEVLEVPCSACAADAGSPCDTSFPRPSLAGLALRGFSGVHLRRYMDRTHDPR